MLRSVTITSAVLCRVSPTLFISHKCLNLHQSCSTSTNKTFTPLNVILTKTHSSRSSFVSSEHPPETELEFGDEEIREDDDEGCPWEGSILYKRNAAISHLEYCTTLERLGLGKVSSEMSKNRASEMGIRVVKPVKDSPGGTPVLISVDVTRRKHKLRLDGIVRTVLALNCNRCGEPATQSVYSDFSLLLCEEPIQEPETINMGVIFGDLKRQTFDTRQGEDEDEDASIDIDDQLYFPQHEKTIDISKNIRDLIHVEITISAICDPRCKGLCLRCGMNLNISSCACNNDNKVEEKSYGPLGDLKKQMQQL